MPDQTSGRFAIALYALYILFLAVPLHAADKTTAKDFITEPATLLSLGFEWRIDGDDNRNATVAVSYRMKGETAWKDGLPLLRIGNERINENALQYITPNGFAGSIFELAPDTVYEARFVMTDPDGIAGKAETIVTVRTRAEPMPAPGGKVYHVYPPEYKGEKQEPAFTGLLGAYYTGYSSSDNFNTYPPRVQPGDTILIHAGRIQGRPLPLRRRPRHGVERHLLPDPERDGREADRHQRRGRRRGDLRRRRCLQPLQRHGRELQLLRGADDPQHRPRVPGRARRTSPARAA